MLGGTVRSDQSRRCCFKSTKERNPESSMWDDVGSEIPEDAGAGSSQPMRGTIGCAFRAGGLYAGFPLKSRLLIQIR